MKIPFCECVKMKHLKKLTLLHSNDMHGDFMAKEANDRLIGGVSMLSGYVNKVRREEKNVIYSISGDMFRGSLIDSEYKGLSTIEIMNILAPDVVTLGNHEIDYGIAHLLFIERCAKFPIINANIYLTNNGSRLFRSHEILEVDGMKVLFIGLITEQVLSQTRQDKLIGSFLDVHEAANEVGKICNSYQSVDIDFTVLLTHIGFDADKELARALDPRWGVDIIIGGHSHTLLSEPAVVEGIPIVQAANGTAQIGRFDIVVDTDNNCIDSYTWQLVPIDGENCERDLQLESVIEKYKNQTDMKYSRVVTRFREEYFHPERNRETQLGRIFSDVFKDALGLDIMLLGSGSIRNEQLGPIVTLQDLIEMFPYKNEIERIYVTGAQLRAMLMRILRDEALNGKTEFYQLSHGFRVVYSRSRHELISVELDGREVEREQVITVGLQEYDVMNMKEFFGVDRAEIELNGKIKTVATSCFDVLEENLGDIELVTVPSDRRLIIVE